MSNGILQVGTTGGQINFSATQSAITPPAGNVALYGETSGGVTILKTIDSNGNVAVFGSSGTSGVNGATGAPGPVGPTGPPNGTSGTSGVSGSSGSSGSSGTSGVNGSSGSSGTSGNSGANGSSGTSGVSGSSGTSGSNGVSGSSGTSGSSGAAGAAGSSGTSGSSGSNGSSGTSGISQPGTPGTSGSSGTSGVSGSSGTSGVNGANGSSGTSGANGANGSSGTSGANGSSGTSGSNGTPGSSGSSGTSGVSGTPSPIVEVATDTLVSVATGATASGNNSIAIGSSAQSSRTNTLSSIAIGYKARAFDGTNPAIAIGECVTACGGSNFGSVVVGYNQNQDNTFGAISFGVGNVPRLLSKTFGLNNCPGEGAIMVGQSNLAIGPYFGQNQIIFGASNQSQRCDVIAGFGNVSCGSFSSMVGHSNCQTTYEKCNSVFVGSTNVSSAEDSVQIGQANIVCLGATGGITIGKGNTVNHQNAVVIGNSTTSSYANTVHLNNVFALGQGASDWYANGNVTGTATINFNNGNNQGLSLTGSTTLTFSNPLPGANYTLAVTQAGSGSYTITWPTIKWVGSAPPALSTAVGKTDLISLTYDGTNYWGTYAYNFG